MKNTELKIFFFISVNDATKPFGTETSEDLVHKFVFLADDRNISQVYVAGQLVKK